MKYMKIIIVISGLIIIVLFSKEDNKYILLRYLLSFFLTIYLF